MDALWEIQRIMENPNNRITIGLEGDNGPESIVGFATGDTFSFSTGAEYNDIAELMGAAASELIGAVKNMLPGRAGGAVDAVLGAISGINAASSLIGRGKTVAGSIKSWSGSVSQLPPIELVFVALTPESRPLNSAKRLLSMCMPGKPFGRFVQSDTDVYFWAPNRYSPIAVLEEAINGGLGYGGNIRGTCSLTIGNWFEAHGLLPNAAQFEVSKETTKQGHPLYVVGSVQFVTYRDMKAVEYDKMFHDQ